MFRKSAIAACLILLSLTTTLQAVENPAELFSPDVSLVVRLKNPQATTEKLAALADAIQPGFGQQIKANAQGVGVAISNPAMAGVDQEKDWWLGIFASDEKEPTIVFVIPATDLKAMQEAVQQAGEFQFIEHNSWGIYTADPQTAENVKACIDGKTKPLVNSVDDELKATFVAGDFSVFINVANLTKTYEVNIQEAKDALAQQADNSPPAAQPFLEMYLELANPLFQALKDSSGAVVAIGVDKSGASLETLAKFQNETQTAKLLSPAVSENLMLQRLPAGGQAYFAMSRIPAVMLQWTTKMMEASSELLDQDSAALDNFKEVMQKIQKLKNGGSAGMFSVVEEGEHPGVRSVSLLETQQPKQMRLLTKQLTSAQSELNFGGVTTRYEYTENVETIGDLKIDTLLVEQEFPENPFFPVGDFYKLFFGEEGMLTRLAYTDQHVVQTMGGGLEAMQTVLKRLEQIPAPTQDAAFNTTRNALSKKANLIALVDLPGFLSRAARLLLGSGLVPVPLDVDSISVPEKPSYLGFSVATQAQGVRFKVYLPAEQAKGSYLLGMQVFQAFVALPQQNN